MSKIIAIANQKGGVGKTTTTVNLGAALALQGKKVCLIDLDPQANLSSYLDFEDNNVAGINEMMMCVVQGVKIRDEINVQYNKTNNIYFVPADINLASADFYLSQALARESVLKRVLSADCFNEFDYILIDCLPSLGVLLMNALTAAHGVIIPVQTQKFALNGLSGLTEVIAQIKSTVNPSLEIVGVLATMVDNTIMSKNSLNSLKDVYGDKLFETTISRSVEAAYSSERCRSLCLDINSKLGQEYIKLAGETAKF